MVEITLDVRSAEIQELELERPSDSDELVFSVTGHVVVEDEKVDQIMQAQSTEPVSLTIKTD